MKKRWILPSLLCVFSLMLTGVLSGCSSKDKDKDKSSSPSQVDTEESQEPEQMKLVQFDKAGDDSLIATVKTSMGEFKAVLYPDYAPKAVENFYQHAVDGYYNGRIFYRVVSELILQTGDPTDKGRGGESIWKEPFEDEFSHNLWNFRGALTMYNDDKKDNNGSRFMIVQAKTVDDATIADMESHSDVFPEEVVEKYKTVGGVPYFDHRYTVFGYIVSGIDTVDKIAAVEVDENDIPTDKIIIESIEFNRKLHTKIADN